MDVDAGRAPGEDRGTLHTTVPLVATSRLAGRFRGAIERAGYDEAIRVGRILAGAAW